MVWHATTTRTTNEYLSTPAKVSTTAVTPVTINACTHNRTGVSSLSSSVIRNPYKQHLESATSDDRIEVVQTTIVNPYAKANVLKRTCSIDPNDSTHGANQQNDHSCAFDAKNEVEQGFIKHGKSVTDSNSNNNSNIDVECADDFDEAYGDDLTLSFVDDIATVANTHQQTEKMNQYERFCSAILRWPFQMYIDACNVNYAIQSKHSNRLWEKMCRRLDLDVSCIKNAPILPKYSTRNEHCKVRTIILLEEVRQTICADFFKAMLVIEKNQIKQRSKRNNPYLTSDDEIVDIDQMSVMVVNLRILLKTNNNESNHSSGIDREQELEKVHIVSLKSTDIYFGSIGWGSVVLVGTTCDETCAATSTATQHGFSIYKHQVLGIVSSFFNDMYTNIVSMEITVYRYGADPGSYSFKEESTIVVTEVTQIFSLYCCYAALVGNYQIHFESQLLGHGVKKNTIDINDDKKCLLKECEDHEYFNIPKLNVKQGDAASKFLSSKPNSISIIQGPPGTGKTTMIVAILCQYLVQNVSVVTPTIIDQKSLSFTKNPKKPEEMVFRSNGRVMVCAPTNKAVSVLAKRFLQAMQKHSTSYAPINVIVVGSPDKMLADDGDGNHDVKYPKRQRLTEDQLLFKSKFLCKWMDSVIYGYKRIKAVLMQEETNCKYDNDTKLSIRDLAIQLRQKIQNSLSHLPDTLNQRMDKIVYLLQLPLPDQKNLDFEIAALTKELKALDIDAVSTMLLSSANVIFCTLFSSANFRLKKTEKIHDLIIDEAAAATEPELYIPFHLEPKRLLIVGDPKQLPATVKSNRAKELNYDRSLHQRLMYDCKYEYIMLNEQYRMHPEIASLPSSRFYKNAILNGGNVTDKMQLKGAKLLNHQPYVFLQSEGKEERDMNGSAYNETEAMIVVNLIINLKQKSFLSSSSSSNNEWYKSDRIRVITFYRAQVNCIRKLLDRNGLDGKVVVSSVDSSQGCEADIVLVSFVRSHGNTNTDSISTVNGTYRAGFLSDDRRMNVALTRARFQLICIGNVDNFHQMIDNAATLRAIASDAQKRNITLNASKVLPSIEILKTGRKKRKF